MGKKFSKGQIFTLDFVIAMAVVVLAIGMVLNFYEMTMYEAKETQIKNELNIIALNAGNNYLLQNPCNPSPAGSLKFSNQGYELSHCVVTSSFVDTEKDDILIPDDVECYITLDKDGGGAPDEIMSYCPTEPGSSVQNIASIKRKFLAAEGTGVITKKDFEDCIEFRNDCDDIYETTPYELTVMVWKA